MQVFISVLLITMWGIFSSILNVYKFGFGLKIRGILVGLSLYVTMIVAILIGEQNISWYIFLAFLFLIPGGIGISYFENWLLDFAYKEKINQQRKELIENRQSNAKAVMFIFSFVVILLMSWMNTPISILNQYWEPIAFGSTALIITTILCTILSGFSLMSGHFILIHRKHPLVKNNTSPLLSELFAAVPAIYGTALFLVTGNTLIGIFFDIIAIVFLLLFASKLRLLTVT